MEISRNFNQLSFHDASIGSVKRNIDRVQVSFDCVMVASEHPDACGKVIELRNATVTFLNVKSERALIWYDDQSPIVHPYPEAPVNEVMHGTRKEDCFHFDGFWQPDDWSEWYIYTDNFVVTGRSVAFTRAAI